MFNLSKFFIRRGAPSKLESKALSFSKAVSNSLLDIVAALISPSILKVKLSAATPTAGMLSSFNAAYSTDAGSKNSSWGIFFKIKEIASFLAFSIKLASAESRSLLPITIRAPSEPPLISILDLPKINSYFEPPFNPGKVKSVSPRLKGGSKYELIFGRSKIEISGGSEGARIVIGKSDRDSALASLIEKAKKEAISLILKKIPQEEFLLPASVEYAALKEESIPAVGVAADNFTFNMEGEIRAATMSRSELETALLKDNALLSSFDCAPLRIKNLDKLNINLINYKFYISIFTIQISGTAEVEAVLDQAAIKNKIIEKGIVGASAVLSEYAYISRAEISFKPFWTGLFYKKPPKDPNRIDIILR